MFSQLFPKTNYVTYPDGMSKPPVTLEMLDILRRVRFIDNYGNLRAYQSYYVKTGETPDIVASKLYGSSDWYWLIMLFNDMTDPFNDWPRDGPDTDIQNVSYDVDVISYIPVGADPDGILTADELNPYSVGDTIIRTDEEGNLDTVNQYTSTITNLRNPVLGIDISIPDGSGVRLGVGDWFGVADGSNLATKVNQVKLVRNPVTTISKFETQDGRELSPFTNRNYIDTTSESINNPLTDLATTLLVTYMNLPDSDYSQYFRSVKYSLAVKAEQNRKIKVFPPELKEAVYKDIARLLSQNPSTGRNSRITNSSSANPVKLSLV